MVRASRACQTGMSGRQQRHRMRPAPAEPDEREQEDHDAGGLVDVVADVLHRARLDRDHGDARPAPAPAARAPRSSSAAPMLTLPHRSARVLPHRSPPLRFALPQ